MMWMEMVDPRLFLGEAAELVHGNTEIRSSSSSRVGIARTITIGGDDFRLSTTEPADTVITEGNDHDDENHRHKVVWLMSCKCKLVTS
jgi:hypothetical protein